MKIELEIGESLADVLENSTINLRHVKLPKVIKVTFQNCQVPEKVTISLGLTESLDWLLRQVLDDDKFWRKLKSK